MVIILTRITRITILSLLLLSIVVVVVIILRARPRIHRFILREGDNSRQSHDESNVAIDNELSTRRAVGCCHVSIIMAIA